MGIQIQLSGGGRVPNLVIILIIVRVTITFTGFRILCRDIIERQFLI